MPEKKTTAFIGIHLDESLKNDLDNLKISYPAYSVAGFRNEVIKLGIESFKKRKK